MLFRRTTINKGKYTVRDISEMDIPSPSVLAGIQAKVSAGANMKTAIKRYLEMHQDLRKCSHIKALISSMEEWCNV